jgi:hypothetical protein
MPTSSPPDDACRSMHGRRAYSDRLLGVNQLNRGLDVEHPIAGDELRAIKRYIAIRTDALPWCSSPNAGSRSRGSP